MVRFRIRTLQFVVAIAAAPLWALGAGIKYGCLGRVMLVWGALVAVPLLLMGLSWLCVSSEPAREQVLAFFGGILIVGYLMAIPGSWFAISFPIYLR